MRHLFTAKYKQALLRALIKEVKTLGFYQRRMTEMWFQRPQLVCALQFAANEPPVSLSSKGSERVSMKKRLLYLTTGLVVALAVLVMPASALTQSSGVGTDAGTQAVFTAPQGGAIGADTARLVVGEEMVTSWMDLQATINQVSTEARTRVAVKSIQVEQSSIQASQFPTGMKVVANDAAQQIADLQEIVLRADNGTAADIAMQNDVMIAAKTMIQADQSKIPQAYGMDMVAAQTMKTYPMTNHAEVFQATIIPTTGTATPGSQQARAMIEILLT